MRKPLRRRCGRRRAPPRWPLAALVLAVGAAAAADGLLVASRDNQRILRYDASTGAFLGTLVEPVSQGFRTPAGIALHPGDGALYVSSAGSGEVWRYDVATGQAVIPPVASGLLQPAGIAFDPTGSALYFVDPADELSTGHDAVKRLHLASGSVTTIGVETSAEFSQLALSGAHVYASDAAGGRVVRFPTSGGSGSIAIQGLVAPGALLFRAPGDLLVAETGADRVLEYTESAGAWQLARVVLDATAGVDAPAGLALAPDGRLSVSGQLSNNVVAVDLGGLAASELVPASGSPLMSAGPLVWSGGTLLVASLAANAVLYFDAAGSPTGQRASGLSPPVDAGFALSDRGTLVAASGANNDLVEYDASGGGVVRQFFDACPSSLDAPYDAAFGPDGNLYVTCEFSNSVHRFDAVTGDPLGFFVTSGSGGLFFPQGLAFGPGGNLFVVSRASNEVLEYDGSTGAFLSVFVASAQAGSSPVDLVFRGAALYVSFAGSDEVRAYAAADGAPLGSFVAPGAGGLDAPAGLSFGPDGRLYVASLSSDEVLAYDGASGAFHSVFVTAGSGGLDAPVDLAFDVEGEPAPVPALLPLPALLAGLALAGVGARALRGAASPRAGGGRP